MAHGAVLTRAKLRDCLSVQNARLGVVLQWPERTRPLEARTACGEMKRSGRSAACKRSRGI